MFTFEDFKMYFLIKNFYKYVSIINWLFILQGRLQGF